jgi:GT2 family glycosyltransferase/glycosyltransferase involved in cell wall biosynthesis
VPALIVSYTSHSGGAERILADHATAIGDDAIAAVPEGWLAERLREQGIRVFPLRARPMEMRGQRLAAAAHLAGHAREVRRLAQALRPRALVAWGMRSAIACAAAAGGLEPRPRLVFQHNDLLPSGAAGRAVRAAAGRADLMIALSQAIADDLGAEATVIRPGTDLERFRPAEGSAGRQALFLGAIAGWKRPQLAIEATRRAGVPLTIAGGPLDPAGARLEASLRESAPPHVTFAGRLEDPVPALQEAGVLLHCADREPYGMALVEALACGVPVVAPAAGGPREIVDESCGRLYEPADPAAAATALTTTLEQRDELGRGARARAEQRFDLDGSRGRYAGLFPRAEPARGDGVALVTVLHDSEPEVRALIDSIERHLPGARLIAVDSGSSDGGAAAVRERGGAVIELEENVGYGRGVNAGVRAAEEPVTVVVNPDVELVDDSIAELAAEAARHDDRLLAPLVLLPDGTRQDSVHTDRADLARAVVPGRAGPWDANDPRKVTWAVGCAIAAQTATLRRLGPFDEDAFMYAEDLELGLRAAEQGVETWFWPGARLVHKRAHSTQDAFGGEPFDMLAERRRAVVEQRRGSARRDDLVQAATFANRIALKALLRRPRDREKAQLRALLRARRQR